MDRNSSLWEGKTRFLLARYVKDKKKAPMVRGFWFTVFVGGIPLLARQYPEGGGIGHHGSGSGSEVRFHFYRHVWQYIIAGYERQECFYTINLCDILDDAFLRCPGIQIQHRNQLAVAVFTRDDLNAGRRDSQHTG